MNSKVKISAMKKRCFFFYNRPTAEECQTDTIKAFRPLKLQQETVAKKHLGQRFKASYLQQTPTFTLSLTFLLVGAARYFIVILFLV